MRIVSWCENWLARVKESPFWAVVFLPFVATRLALLLVGWFARTVFVANPTYARYIERGFNHTRYLLVDMWTNWDGGFYYSIVQNGYQASPDLTQTYSNVAFFPLYPYLVRWLSWLIPAGDFFKGWSLLVGLVVSNVCFLAAAWLLYRLVVEVWNNEAGARRAVELWMVFPASFFFSSFYPESLFVLLSVAACRAALKERWWLAGALAGLATVTRGQGVLLAVPLAWLYMDARGWNWGKIRWDVLAFGGIPLALGGFLGYLYSLTGDFFAPLTAQLAWGRWAEGGLIQTLRDTFAAPGMDPFKIDTLLMALFVAAGLALLRDTRSRGLGVYTLLLLALPLSSGMMVSVSRHLSVAFPVFIGLGLAWKDARTYAVARAVSFAILLIYFAGFVNFYWIA